MAKKDAGKTERDVYVNGEQEGKGKRDGERQYLIPRENKAKRTDMADMLLLREGESRGNETRPYKNKQKKENTAKTMTSPKNMNERKKAIPVFGKTGNRD